MLLLVYFWLYWRAVACVRWCEVWFGLVEVEVYGGPVKGPNAECASISPEVCEVT